MCYEGEDRTGNEDKDGEQEEIKKREERQTERKRRGAGDSTAILTLYC